MGTTLLKKVWDLHTVRQLPSGQTQLFIGLHLVHEVTSPQAFDELRHRGWKVARPDRTFATVDHIVPTKVRTRPFLDVMQTMPQFVYLVPVVALFGVGRVPGVMRHGLDVDNLARRDRQRRRLITIDVTPVASVGSGPK